MSAAAALTRRANNSSSVVTSSTMIRGLPLRSAMPAIVPACDTYIWYNRTREVTEHTTPAVHCAQCGIPLQPSATGQRARYCSAACKKRAEYLRNRQGYLLRARKNEEATRARDPEGFKAANPEQPPPLGPEVRPQRYAEDVPVALAALDEDDALLRRWLDAILLNDDDDDDTWWCDACDGLPEQHAADCPVPAMRMLLAQREGGITP